MSDSKIAEKWVALPPGPWWYLLTKLDFCVGHRPEETKGMCWLHAIWYPDRILERKTEISGETGKCSQGIQPETLNPNYMFPRRLLLRKIWGMCNPLLRSIKKKKTTHNNKGKVSLFFLGSSPAFLYTGVFQCGKNSICRLCEELGHNLFHLIPSLASCFYAWRLPGERKAMKIKWNTSSCVPFIWGTVGRSHPYTNEESLRNYFHLQEKNGDIWSKEHTASQRERQKSVSGTEKSWDGLWNSEASKYVIIFKCKFG